MQKMNMQIYEATTSRMATSIMFWCQGEICDSNFGQGFQTPNMKWKLQSSAYLLSHIVVELQDKYR